MVNTEGLASVEICYQHLACRNNEEELVSSESGMAMPWKGPCDIRCGDRQIKSLPESVLSRQEAMEQIS